MDRNRAIGLVIAVVVIVTTIYLIESQFGRAPTAALQPTGTPTPTIAKNVGVKIGEIAPDFTRQTLIGDNVSLSGFRGKAVMINFWATWCAACLDELADIQKVYSKLKKNGFEVIAVNRAESVEKQLQYLSPFGIEFAIAQDPTDELFSRVYNPVVMPSSFFIDKNGIIVAKKSGQMVYGEIEDYALRALNAN